MYVRKLSSNDFTLSFLLGRFFRHWIFFVQCPYKKLRKVPAHDSIVERINTQTQLKWSLFNSNVGPYAFDNRFDFLKISSDRINFKSDIDFLFLLLFLFFFFYCLCRCHRYMMCVCKVHQYVWSNRTIWASLVFII